MNTKRRKLLVQYWFIARDFVDKFEVSGETVARFRSVSLE